VSAAGKVAAVAGVLLLGGAIAWTLVPHGDDAPGADRAATSLAAGAPVPTLEGSPRGDSPPPAAAGARGGADAVPARVEGRVSETGPISAPIVGAKVIATLEDGAGRVLREVARADAGSDGRFAFALGDLDAGDPVLRATRQVRVTASAAGFVGWNPASTVDVARLVPGATAEVALSLARGRVAHGVVLGPDGAPAGPGVRVALRIDGDGNFDSVWVPTDGEGRYRIPIVGEVEEGRVTASLPDVGTARSEPLALDGAHDVAVPPLRLAGHGTLAGTVRFPDGSPVAHASVACRSVPEGDAEADGLVESEGRADAEGRFRLAGLGPGTFAVWAGPPPPAGEAARHAAGSEDVELVVRRRRVHARVVDGEGRGVAGARVWIRWVHPNPDDVDDPRLEDGSSGEATDPDGWVDAWYDDGDRVRLALATDGLETTEVEAPGGDAWSREVVLVAREAPSPGRLRVRRLDPDGRPLPKASLEVEKPLTGVPEIHGKVVALDDEVSVPSGEWRVVVGEPEGARLGFLFPEARLVTVRPGETQDVEVRARPAGRLRITVQSVDEAAWKAAEPSILVTPRDGGRATRGYGVVMTLDGGWRTGGLEPGVPGVLMAPLVPGRHRVRIEARGFVPFERDVTVPALGFADLVVEPQPVRR
jgi:hypothetical protein